MKRFLLAIIMVLFIMTIPAFGQTWHTADQKTVGWDAVTTNIRITRDAGNFTDGVGVIRAIVYYQYLITAENS